MEMYMRKPGFFVALLATLLASCGGSSSDDAFRTPGPAGTGPAATPTSLVVISDATSIPADGSTPAGITAIARDASNVVIANVPVTLSASSGSISVGQATTDAVGEAKAVLSTAGDSTPRNIIVTARSGALTASVTVAVAPSSTTTTVNIGNGSGAAFQPNVLAVAVPSLSAGGSTSVVVSIVRSDNTLYTSPATLTFNSPCIAANRAAIQPQATVTTQTGQATVTYVASGCAGSDVITATTTIGSQNLSASGTVTVAPATIGSIVFVSATPTNIALRGTGESGRPETSTVVFRVRDSSNGPVAGANVAFSLSTTVGGITLTSATAISDSQGNVQAIVNAGTVATPVTVAAQVVGSPAIGTQSSQLTISTGIPTAGSFSLAVSCQNIEGWDYDGTIASVTARLADRFSNPAPNGTAVSFQAEGGSILPQCQTTTNANEGGVCSVDWRSSNPRPADGRATLLATAIGEESFIDGDGNGAFTAADTFRLVPSGGNPAHDLGEPFLDMNEDGVYDTGIEPFYDFYNNAALGQLGLRDGPDTKFNGALCQDPARCPNLVADPQKKSAGIGSSNLIIMSGSNPFVDASFTGPATMANDSARTYTLWIRDLHDNPMPGSTTITAAAAGAGLSVAAPTVVSVPCSTAAAGSLVNGVTQFSFTVTSGTTDGTGTFSVSIKTPRNASAITFTYSVTVL
jgi:hypothetical protein